MSLCAFLGLIFAVPGNAVIGGFETNDGNLDSDGMFDWNEFAPTEWNIGTAPYRESENLVSGRSFKGIEDDQVSNADTAFSGGTKQDDDCATTKGGKAPNKDDLKRIYLSTNNVAGDTFLQLAWVRIPQNTTSASAHVAFEFNQGTTLCDASDPDGLVEREPGDALFVYDFEGGSASPEIKLARWTEDPLDSCDIANHNPPCWGETENLTGLGYAEAAVNVGEAVEDDLTPPSPPATTSTTESLGDSEFGEAGINLTDAGVFEPGQCESFGTAFGVSRSSGNSGNAQMKDLVGPADFTLANCGTVIIHKETTPDEDPNTTTFGFTTDVTTTPAMTTSPFSLMDDGTETIENVNPGTGLNVTEDNPTGLGYKLVDIDCDDSTVPSGNISPNTTTRAVTFDLAAGEVLECTFTNDLQEGALRIEKRSTKTGNLVNNAGAVFSYDSTMVTDNGSGDEDNDVGEVCVSGLTPGTYTVDETTPPDGYGPGLTDVDGETEMVTVADDTDCTGNPPGAGATATFFNPPLSDIQVRFRDGGSGETALFGTGIQCDNATGNTTEETNMDGWDDLETVEDVEIDYDPNAVDHQTITCTIKIDP